MDIVMKMIPHYGENLRTEGLRLAEEWDVLLEEVGKNNNSHTLAISQDKNWIIGRTAHRIFRIRYQKAEQNHVINLKVVNAEFVLRIDPQQTNDSLDQFWPIGSPTFRLAGEENWYAVTLECLKVTARTTIIA